MNGNTIVRFISLRLLFASRPRHRGFFVYVHQIDAGRDYPVAPTSHAGIDDATEGELEHHIPLGHFHELDTAQTGLC